MMLPSVHSSNDNGDSKGEDKQSSTVDSSNNPTRATQNVNNSNNDTSDILDPTMTDREANMHVTTWARSNYVQERDHNVPRRNMYEHYKAHCAARNLTPVNSATFGKSDQILTITEDNSGSTRDNISTSPSAASSVHSTASNILDSSISIQLPPFMKPNILSYPHTNELDATIHSFISAYENHCRQILYLVTHHQVDKIQQVMALFYDRMPENFQLLIHEVPEITEAVWRYDSLFYDEIYDLLTVKISLDHWMNWVSSIVDSYLKKFTPSSSNDASHYLAQAKQFLLKWNFYTSLIMKGLARQNARSFSSFHTIHLFLDDYALYLVEETIAQANYILMRQQQVIQQTESSSTATTSTSATRTNIYSSPSSSTSKGNLS
ncbi:hypothetical protein RMCBS344292_17970 [Rhizopus microsporus]|nr:hypothetical protein RMCBS344292_17970 [Rhizopus microsporus]